MTDSPTDPAFPIPPRPETGAAEGSSSGSEPGTVAFSPVPERRPEWASPDWGTPWSARQDPPTASESGTGAPVQPVSPGASRGDAGPQRASGGVGQLVAAAILSAVLASGGTVVALQASGALRGPSSAGSSQPTVSESRQPVAIDESSAVVDVAARVAPAVVQITATGTTTDPLGGSIPDQGVGSGVIYDAGGWILTNRHVVTTQGNTVAQKLTVLLKDGREFTGTVYGIDTLTDLAIVRIDAPGLVAAQIGHSGDIKVGQLAIAIGSPLGTYTSTVTSGIVSATGRSVLVDSGVRINNLIQTDAAINPGNSGGPLLDAAGQIIGINTAVERGSTGIGFAIPIDIARPIMVQALAGEPLARPYLGIRYRAIDIKLQAEKKLPVDHGALIGPAQDASGATLPAITPDSPAAAAGLKDGDIVTSIEGQQVDTEHPLDAILTSYAPGQTVKLSVIRDGKSIDVSVTLGTRPGDL